MNRNLWTSVAATVAAMAALDYAANDHGGTRKAVAFLAQAMPRANQIWDSAGRVFSWDVVGLLTVALLVVLLVARRKRRPGGLAEPWRRVVELGRQGQQPATIARTTRQSQDAVRILLTAVAVDRMPARGKPFRSNDPGRSEPPFTSQAGEVE